jgi:UDP-N-acetylglucosamine diphosphorylase/glucosamine-1-phosphate N-acetyltransferase
MNYILFDDSMRANLLPLVFIRPVADIRIGILTIREKWEYYLKSKTFTLTEDYLSEKYPLNIEEDNFLINASVIPTKELVDEILKLKNNQALSGGEYIIAYKLKDVDFENFGDESMTNFEEIETDIKHIKLNNTWEIFQYNHQEIENDFKLITKKRKSQPLPSSNRLIGNKDNLFIEEGAVIECSTINVNNGPVYIAKDAEIMEGSLIRGPFALCEHSQVKMGAKIYGATTVGPYSKVGGELNNVVIFGYSNKAHDGFVGNSVIGEWCNIGADSNTSNLKNTYDEVKLWNYFYETFVNTGLQFCGLIMGDYSKCGINTMFNTGTVVGVNSNIYGSGFHRNFIPSFSWGGNNGFKTYEIDKAIDVAKRVYERRNIEFTRTDENILTYVFNITHKIRRSNN